MMHFCNKDYIDQMDPKMNANATIMWYTESRSFLIYETFLYDAQNKSYRRYKMHI